MPLLQEDQEGRDRGKNRSRDQQGLQAQSPSFLRPPAGAQRCKIPAPPQVPAAKKRSPSRKRRSRSRINLSESPIPSGKSLSPCRKSPSPSRSRSSRRRKLDAGKASTRMQAKQQTPQSREPQPQEPQPQQQEPQPQPQCRTPSRKSGSPIRKGRSPSSKSSSPSRRRSPSRKIRSPSRKSRRPTRKSRKSRSPCRSRGQITHALHAVAGHQLFLGLREGIVERAALGYDAIPSADLLPFARDPNQPLPASVGMGNLMVATWAVGRDCDAKLLGEKLCKAPFDFILLVMSTAVAEDDDIYSFLCELSSLQSLPPAERALSNEKRSPRWYLLREVLEEKTVHCLGRSGVTGSPTHLPPSGWKGRATFVALHKAKVTNASYEDHYIRSRGPDSGIDFGTLRLTMDQSRQRMPEVRVGVIDVRRVVDPRDTDALVAWAVTSRIDMLTGFFGLNNLAAFVSDLAARSGAISWTPLFQAIRSRGDDFVHPSFFLFFGFYTRITVPEEVPIFPADLRVDLDIWNDMVLLKDMPWWQRNDRGSAFLHNMGVIKMNRVDWKRWFDGVFQTCLWLGTSTPSISSQEKCRQKGNKGDKGGKGTKDKFVYSVVAKDKGKDKGKGKGKDKDKDKSKPPLP